MKTYTIHFSLASSYLKVLEGLSHSLDPNDSPDSFDRLPFIVTCAATLECVLNESIIQYAIGHFPPEDVRRIAGAHLSMSLRGKLDCVVPLLSKSEFVNRRDSAAYQHLVKLISVRNTLMHNKSYLDDYGTEAKENADGTFSLGIAKQLLDRVAALPTSSECANFFSSLRLLFSTLTSEGPFEDNAFIQRNM
jgi:hypothetical protein